RLSYRIVLHTTPLRRPVVFFYGRGAHRHLHSFSTRRSSDLAIRECQFRSHITDSRRGGHAAARLTFDPDDAGKGEREEDVTGRRSEEHTSELHSRENLVCRLLLEKKK